MFYISSRYQSNGPAFWGALSVRHGESIGLLFLTRYVLVFLPEACHYKLQACKLLEISEGDSS